MFIRGSYLKLANMSVPRGAETARDSVTRVLEELTSNLESFREADDHFGVRRGAARQVLFIMMRDGDMIDVGTFKELWCQGTRKMAQ